MKSIKNIGFIISSLGSGGAERVISNMANYWVEKGVNISIYTLQKGEIFYELNPNINVVQLDLYKQSTNKVCGIFNNLKRIKVIKREVVKHKHDIIISFGLSTNILALLAFMFNLTPIIVSERTYPSTNNIRETHWSILRNIVYHRANKVVVQTNAAKDYFKNRIRRETVVIPNPVTVDASCIINKQENNKDRKVLLAMGRLSYEKGFDILLKAFALIKDKNPEWDLVIWGEGKERKKLEKLIADLGIKERVKLPGRTKKPIIEMCKADIFVLSSRREGFPNVLCEAMSAGLPVIATDCLSGPRDIITDQIDGILVQSENIEQLAAAMDKLMNDKDTRQYLGANAKDNIRRFEIDKIMKMWEYTIERVISK